MAGSTWFERQMEKALTRNTEAMFQVPIGDSHRHAYVKGQRQGLVDAFNLFKTDPLANDDQDDI